MRRLFRASLQHIGIVQAFRFVLGEGILHVPSFRAL